MCSDRGTSPQKGRLMGVVKRIDGWRRSGWPIPNTLQMLVGLIPYRDPEGFQERKRAARESERERSAIREEGGANRRFVAELRASLTAEGRRPENEHLYDVAVGDADDELPVRAADGWYRVGRSFYRVGQGPFAEWIAARPPEKVQRMLF